MSLPWWWTYPTKCGNGHAWGPGKVIVSWLPCQCGPARAAQPRGSGHRTISCRVPGCRYACYDPPHQSEPGQGNAAGQEDSGLTPGTKRRRPCALSRHPGMRPRPQRSPDRFAARCFGAVTVGLREPANSAPVAATARGNW